MTATWDAEVGVLRGEVSDCPFPTEGHLRRFFEGEYNRVVESEEWWSRVVGCSGAPASPSASPEDALLQMIDNYVAHCGSPEREFELLCVGVASLSTFIQSNWTGPHYAPLNETPFPVLHHLFHGAGNSPSKALLVDGEEASVSVSHPELLIVAKAIFRSKLPSILTLNWWLLRATFIHQQVIEESSPTLQTLVFDIGDQLLKSSWVTGDLLVLLNLEMARINLHYGRVNVSASQIHKAMDTLQIEVGFKGALGKRTYHQVKEVAQLTVDVSVNCRRPTCPLGDAIDFPKDVFLEDDVRLHRVAFSNPKDGEFPDLQPLEQAVILALFVQKNLSNAKDRILNEELMAYINCLLSQPKVWSIYVSSLTFRTHLESEHRRTIERSLLQMEGLLNLNSYSTPLRDRLHLFFVSYTSPSFVIAAETASIMLAMGGVQSALDIYLRLEKWDEVITCYTLLKLRSKAADVIRSLLAKQETVRLWCSLGDATDDSSCYEKAWELSNYKSAQAQRHWGFYFYKKKMYGDCISHFEESLKLNSLQVSLWFRLGFATLNEERWEESASAFRRYCNLEPDSFEAWNNLAKAYIRLGQKERAYSALQEAVKCNYEVWQVWDNMMAVSSDCRDFEQVIFCYHRILDLKEKHIDDKILSVLTSVIVNGVNDSKGRQAYCHRKKALELFGRITSKVMNNPTIWQLYADLTASVEQPTYLTRSKVVQYLQKAYNAALQDALWSKHLPSTQNVISLCVSLGCAALESSKHSTTPKETAHLLTSAKFSLISVITKVKTEHSNVVTGKLESSLKIEIDSLEKVIESIENELSRLNL